MQWLTHQESILSELVSLPWIVVWVNRDRIDQVAMHYEGLSLLIHAMESRSNHRRMCSFVIGCLSYSFEISIGVQSFVGRMNGPRNADRSVWSSSVPVSMLTDLRHRIDSCVVFQWLVSETWDVSMDRWWICWVLMRRRQTSLTIRRNTSLIGREENFIYHRTYRLNRTCLFFIHIERPTNWRETRRS